MCGAGRLQRVVTLTPTPPGNNFLKADELSEPEAAYPLELHFCTSCHHVQLGHVVDPVILYQRDYTYVSATGARFVAHLRQYAGDMAQRYHLGPQSLVVDIGSNDGTCLSFFKAHGTQVLGVDPAPQIARRATAAGIETVNDFFSYDVAVRLRAERGPAAFITSHNACAHIDDLAGVMQGVGHWLARDGVFVLEVGYLLDVYQNLWFDTIYHEHVDYHTVEPFTRLFERTGLEMIRVERVSPQGGSIRVFAQHRGGPRSADATIAASIEEERRQQLNRPETFVDWGNRIDGVGAELRALVQELKRAGRSIAGYGAATKATTLLSHFRIGRDELDYIADDNPLKQGLFSPASHIPVVAPAEIGRRRPDYLLILAWNFADAIMASQRAFAEAGGRFILPMPEPRVVS
jgi:SAM-dependent methyltransferase